MGSVAYVEDLGFKKVRHFLIITVLVKMKKIWLQLQVNL